MNIFVLLPFLMAAGAFAASLAAVLAIAVVVVRKRRSRDLNNEETEQLHQLYEGLKRMEERVSNLETILMSRTRGPTS